MSTCRTCAFWFRGTIVHVDADSKTWDGNPHPDAGKKIVNRHWNGILSSMAIKNTGECRAGLHTAQVPILAAQNGPLISFGYYGCVMWKHDSGSDKFDHHFVRYAGQESLEQTVAKVKEDTEAFEADGIPDVITELVRFHMKDHTVYLEYAEHIGTHQLTHVDKPATPQDMKNHKAEYDEFCNSMYEGV